MKIIQGDLIQLAKDNLFDVIIHGCNCQCTMGAGIAKSIKSNFPEAFKADSKTAKGDHSKLGTISVASNTDFDHEITVVNGYTQFHYRGSGVLVDYQAIKSVMNEVKKNFAGKRIGYPLIGAGLAKGDWKIISEIIETELEGEDHTLVEFVN